MPEKTLTETLRDIMGDSHRIELRWDGHLILGTSTTLARPDNSQEMASLLRRLLELLEAPAVDLSDPEVLGKYKNPKL